MKTTLQIVLESLVIAISIGLVAIAVCAVRGVIYSICRNRKRSKDRKMNKVTHMNLSIEK